LRSCGAEFEHEVARPASFKETARFLVEDVLSTLPELVPTDVLEVGVCFELRIVVSSLF
jgi:hypothetical protein